MRGAVSGLVLVCVLLVLACGVAFAATKKCSGGNCRGTATADTLYGTPRGDRIVARGGDDVVYGGGAVDALHGEAGGDTIRGGVGDDRVYGGPGHDAMSGKAGNDILYGGYGNDNIHGSLDGERDEFHCGPGRDQAVAGPEDYVSADCEIVR